MLHRSDSEYATDMHPAKSDQPITRVVNSSSGLEFTYPKNKAATDVTFTVQWSDSLTAASWSTTEVRALTVFSDNGLTQQTKVIVPGGSSMTKGFIFLKLTKP